MNDSQQPRTGLRPDVDRPISDAFPAIDNDLARDNLENDYDLGAEDLQDL